MTTHLSARIAWHMDGWNGHICRNPSANTYCVGQYSYPGTMIAEKRSKSLSQEIRHQGKPCNAIDYLPPCTYSVNTFGFDPITAYADPPDFFHDETKVRSWKLPPATVCTWPYEEMYADEMKKGNGYDHEKRLQAAREYFSKFELDRSLIFYYTNYSHPFSEEDQRRYLIVGMSRVKKIGEELFYDNCSKETRDRFGGGYVWQRNVTSHYPGQGVRLPYHLYLDRPEILEPILYFPDNPRLFKYGTRHIHDDDALDLVERFLEIVGRLKEIGDSSENWDIRSAWLRSLIAELWKNRGLYPGMPRVLDLLGFGAGIPYFKERSAVGKEKDAKEALFALVEGRRKEIAGLSLTEEEQKKIARQWKLRSDVEKKLLQSVFPRFELPKEHLERVLSDDRAKNGIRSSLDEVVDNPYILSEEFVGDGPDDTISFSKIDHGIFPSPECGGEPMAEPDDSRRLRALCVEQLRLEDRHSFITAAEVVRGINRKLSFLPEWKRHQFSEKYLQVDREDMLPALTFREVDGKSFMYLKTVYEDERAIETQVRSMVGLPDIRFRSPVTEDHWRNFLHNAESILAQRNLTEYERAILGQAKVCRQIFSRPVCVLSGAAGTGKTTIIRAMIRAIEKAHGAGTTFQLLAPTGKAADRIREATGKPASTIHSFLAQRGWLNDNMTFRRSGGRREEGVSTYILDESSMLDLGLTATLFRAVHWGTVQRLIFVGDPNQLPPIGRGKVFADVVDWLTAEHHESVGVLQINLRQMENRQYDRGTGILDLASLYTRRTKSESLNVADEGTDVLPEEMLQRIQEGGEVDRDLRVLYWKDPDELAQLLTSTIVGDMEADEGTKIDPKRPFDLWKEASEDEKGNRRAEYIQVISPYRGEQFGTDFLNVLLQRYINPNMAERGRLDGIALFDKVIQYRNRTRSNPIWAYNSMSRDVEQVEVFNGELGFVKPHGFDGHKWRSEYFRLKHFQVVFSRKEHLWLGYGSELGRAPNGRYFPKEKPQDNLELAYAISVHKAQGSEFERVYFVLPKHKKALLSRELFYTGVTRARRHLTILAEEDVLPFLSMRRKEKSHLLSVNSSLFEFRPLPEAVLRMRDWYEEGKIHEALTAVMVRSKSEVIIANMLAERGVPFRYEVPLFAADGTFYLPDFTITWRGEEWYWEHIGMLEKDKYRNHWETKERWYKKHFSDRLITTREGGDLTLQADTIIKEYFR